MIATSRPLFCSKVEQRARGNRMRNAGGRLVQLAGFLFTFRARTVQVADGLLCFINRTQNRSHFVTGSKHQRQGAVLYFIIDSNHSLAM